MSEDQLKKEDTIPFYPDHVKTEFFVVLGVLGVVLIIADFLCIKSLRVALSSCRLPMRNPPGICQRHATSVDESGISPCCPSCGSALNRKLRIREEKRTVAAVRKNAHKLNTIPTDTFRNDRRIRPQHKSLPD